MMTGYDVLLGLVALVGFYAVPIGLVIIVANLLRIKPRS